MLGLTHMIAVFEDLGDGNPPMRIWEDPGFAEACAAQPNKVFRVTDGHMHVKAVPGAVAGNKTMPADVLEATHGGVSLHDAASPIVWTTTGWWRQFQMDERPFLTSADLKIMTHGEDWSTFSQLLKLSEEPLAAGDASATNIRLRMGDGSWAVTSFRMTRAETPTGPRQLCFSRVTTEIEDAWATNRALKKKLADLHDNDSIDKDGLRRSARSIATLLEAARSDDADARARALRGMAAQSRLIASYVGPEDESTDHGPGTEAA